MGARGVESTPRWSVIVSLLGLALLTARSGHAAEWTITPFASIGGDYDDNAGLASRADEEDEISGGVAQVGAGVAYESQTNLFRIIPKLVAKRYPGDSDRDADDQKVNSMFLHTTRNSQWGARVNFTRDYIRTGERADVDFDTEDPEDIPEDDSGRVGARVRRIKWEIGPRWSQRLSEKAYIATQVRYIDLSYDDTLETRLVDYNQTQASARYSYRLSNLNTALVEANGLWFDAGEADNDSSSYGLLGGIQRSLSQTMRVQALGGIAQTERTLGGSDTNFVGMVNLVRNLETIQLLAQYRRSVAGSGSGTLTQRDQVNVGFTRRLSEVLTASLGGLAYHTSSIEKNVDFDERTYVQLRSRFMWSLTRNLDIEAIYRYSLIDRQDDDESANSNAMTLWLHYRPNKFSWSR